MAIKGVTWPTKGKLRYGWFISLYMCFSVSYSFAYEASIQSKNGFYQLHFSTANEIPIRKLHSWGLTVTTTKGEKFTPSQIVIDGGMPSHGHGLPSEPKFRNYLGEGKLLLEGMLFNMSGTWELNLYLVGPQGPDNATLTLELPLSKKNAEKLDQTPFSTLRAFHIDSVARPTDPSNRLLNNPAAIKLGEQLFFDAKLSASGSISCSSCHQPEKLFTDGLKKSFGTAQLKRHTPSLVGVAQANWFYWDGRRDSLWAQAVTPIETTGEMDNNRGSVIYYLLSDQEYLAQLKQLIKNAKELDVSKLPKNAGPFGNESDKKNWSELSSDQKEQINSVFTVVGKSLAAYISTLEHSPSLFDQAIDAVRNDQPTNLTDQQLAGLKLFLDTEKTHCLRCHNGPLFTNHGFHNIGTGRNANDTFDYGRMFGIQSVAYDAFNCQGKYSDAPKQCDHLKFALKTKLPTTMAGAFKVPSLRNVRATAPYMHDGRFSSLEEVMEFYNSPPDLEVTPHELPQLDLAQEELDALIEFLKIL